MLMLQHLCAQCRDFNDRIIRKRTDLLKALREVVELSRELGVRLFPEVRAPLLVGELSGEIDVFRNQCGRIRNGDVGASQQ